MAYKMSQEFSTASLDITIYLLLFFSSSAFGLKARVNKKGEFPPCGVGEVPPSIIYVWENSSTLKIYFSVCVNLFC